MFFRNHHYSIAQKIIDNVEDIMTTALEQHEFIKRLPDPSVSCVEAVLEGKMSLTKTLNDILKDNLPSNLYDCYRKLSDKEKKCLRKKMANAYFEIIQVQCNQFKNMRVTVSKSYPGGKWDEEGSEEYNITLPEMFFNKDQLSRLLSYPIAVMQQELICAGNELIQFHNHL